MREEEPLDLPTCSFFSVGQVGGDGDGQPLAHAHPDQSLVHAGDHIALPHVRVVGVVARVAVETHGVNREVLHSAVLRRTGVLTT